MITLKVGLDLLRGPRGTVRCGVLCGQDNLVTVLVLLHPLPNPGLALLGLVIVGGINKIPSVLVKEIEDCEARLLVALPNMTSSRLASVNER